MANANDENVVADRIVNNDVGLIRIDAHRWIVFRVFSSQARISGQRSQNVLQTSFIFFDLVLAELIKAVESDPEQIDLSGST